MQVCGRRPMQSSAFGAFQAPVGFREVEAQGSHEWTQAGRWRAQVVKDVLWKWGERVPFCSCVEGGLYCAGVLYHSADFFACPL